MSRSKLKPPAGLLPGILLGITGAGPRIAIVCSGRETDRAKVLGRLRAKKRIFKFRGAIAATEEKPEGVLFGSVVVAKPAAFNPRAIINFKVRPAVRKDELY